MNQCGKAESEKNDSFMDLYLQAVHIYKKMFNSWQAGSKIDILKIRKYYSHY
ncbi:hypothetical protein KHA80_10500 [Anaerobacillus sp. HL2]|nr:hypothetical protein KHA80_10500 [Anaerobacillus sp. HL2]